MRAGFEVSLREMSTTHVALGILPPLCEAFTMACYIYFSDLFVTRNGQAAALVALVMCGVGRSMVVPMLEVRAPGSVLRMCN
jgi:hypothetical protein